MTTGLNDPLSYFATPGQWQLVCRLDLMISWVDSFFISPKMFFFLFVLFPKNCLISFLFNFSSPVSGPKCFWSSAASLIPKALCFYLSSPLSVPTCLWSNAASSRFKFFPKTPRVQVQKCLLKMCVFLLPEKFRKGPPQAAGVDFQKLDLGDFELARRRRRFFKLQNFETLSWPAAGADFVKFRTLGLWVGPPQAPIF